MDIRLFLKQEVSKASMPALVDKLKNDPELEKRFWAEAFSQEQPYAWRAAWVVDHLSDKYPEVIEPYKHKLYTLLPTLSNDGLKRHFMRMLLKLPPDYERIGENIDLFFNWMVTPGEAVCTKAWSLSLLMKLVEVEPDLTNELVAYLEECQERGGTKGWMNVVNKTLIKLSEK